MSNAPHSDKTKPLPKATSASPRGQSSGKEKALRGAQIAGGAKGAGGAKVVGAAKTTKAAKLLADGIVSYANDLAKSPSKRRRRPRSFVNAYANLVEAVPVQNRAPLLRQMLRDIETVVVAVEEPLERTQRSKPSPSRTRKTATENKSATGRKVSTEEFMAGFRLQEIEQRQKDLAAKRLVPGPEMQKRLGVTPQALSAALKAKRIFVMRGPSGGYYYPAFFADPKYDKKVLEQVSKALGDLPGGSKWDFFTSPRISLEGKSPLDALAKGKVEPVMAAANAFVEE